MSGLYVLVSERRKWRRSAKKRESERGRDIVRERNLFSWLNESLLSFAGGFRA